MKLPHHNSLQTFFANRQIFKPIYTCSKSDRLPEKVYRPALVKDFNYQLPDEEVTTFCISREDKTIINCNLNGNLTDEVELLRREAVRLMFAKVKVIGFMSISSFTCGPEGSNFFIFHVKNN